MKKAVNRHYFDFLPKSRADEMGANQRSTKGIDDFWELSSGRSCEIRRLS